MVLWDCVSVFDVKEERDLRHEGILETNVTTRSQGLIKENSLMLLKIKYFKRMLRNFKTAPQLIKFRNLPSPVKILNRSTCLISLVEKK